VIFVTVGEQLPFDRLIRAMDRWASSSSKEVFAQIGDAAWKPLHIQFSDFLAPEVFREKFLAAEIVVAHAGMGTIISALEMEKPLLVMPRRAALGEHRNDHQFATAKRFLALNYISVAFDEAELLAKLDCLDDVVRWRKGLTGKTGPAELLIKTIQDFIRS
jgi:UDP-N-acetylglucosamine transferase subunit ALG13